MSKNLIDRCPFREGTASKKIFVALATATKPLSAEEIKQQTRLSEAKVKCLCAAYLNPYHMAPLKKVGVVVERGKDGGYRLRICKADPDAKRPPRGKKGRKGKGRAKKASKLTKTPKTGRTPPENAPAPTESAQAPAEDPSQATGSSGSAANTGENAAG